MEEYKKIEIQELATAAKGEYYLLSYNGLHYEAKQSIVELLKILQSSANENDAISCYLKQNNGKYTEELIIEVINRAIRPILTNSPTKQKVFLYQKEVFSASTIDYFSNLFSFLFKKALISIVLVLSIVLDCYFMLTTNNLLEFNNQINSYTILGLLLFTFASSFFHEIGHASACKHFGIKHGGVGFGLYLNFPVLYTDVTEAWKLNRKQRCVVNLAGIYFQCFILSTLLILYHFTGYYIARYLILTMNLGFLMTLNPFFKFDGYWVTSDLLGIPNLRERSKELLVYLYKRIRRQPVYNPYLLQVNKLKRYSLFIYSIIVNFFMGYYFLYIIPKFLYNFGCSFPNEIEELTLYLSNNMTPPFALLRNIGIQFIFLGLFILFLSNVLRFLKKRYFNHASF